MDNLTQSASLTILNLMYRNKNVDVLTVSSIVRSTKKRAVVCLVDGAGVIDSVMRGGVCKERFMSMLDIENEYECEVVLLDSYNWPNTYRSLQRSTEIGPTASDLHSIDFLLSKFRKQLGIQ